MKDVVTGVKVLGPYRLWLRFSDGTEGEANLEPWLTFTGVFKPLKDPEYFALARLDPEAGTVVWPNDADWAPETLHDIVRGCCDHEWAQDREKWHAPRE